MELILIRHGLPEHVETSDGTPADPPLDAEGHDQARRMAHWLRDESFDALYSSPMNRAHQTAAPLAELHDLEVGLRDGVAEFDRHSSVYVPVEKLKEEDYERWQRIMQRDANPDFEAFSTAVITELEAIVAAHPGERVAVACHGGVINVWTAHVIGFAPRMFFVPEYTSIHRYRCARSGERTVVALNEAIHLRE